MNILWGTVIATVMAHCCKGAIVSRMEDSEQGMLKYVSTLQGTDSTYAMSYGNTLPLVCVPWGMTNWSPQTKAEGNWFFQPGQKVNGFRATRQPSPWIGDYGQFTLMPQSGDLKLDPVARALEYDSKSSIFRPDYLRLELNRGQITSEMTASERCAVFRFAYHQSPSGRLIIQAAGESRIEITGRTIRGYSRFATGGAGDRFYSYFVIHLDRPIRTSGTFIGEAETSRASTSTEGKDVGAYVEFDATTPVQVSVGTSYISFDQAERNLSTEANDGFDAVRARSSAAWEKNLSRIEIEATEEQKKTFYSCFYRSLIFPHKLYELDANNRPVHYSPYDSQIHPGVLYGDCGAWDMYRTTFPLYTILFPDQFGEILQGWLKAGEEGGSMPEWPSPGYRVSMIGQHTAAMFADAVVKGITPFDVNKAYQMLRRPAFAFSPSPGTPGEGRGEGSLGLSVQRSAFQRSGLDDYLTLGYIPDGKATYASSATLDYAYDDWCIAQIAKRVGDQVSYTALMKRAQNYRLLWNSKSGFMGAKKEDGAWVEPFDQFYWGGPYVEGGPWQCSWAVQHDPSGLADLLGGPAQLGAKLDQMLATPPTFHIGGYEHVIHEMTEMAAAHFGQYAQSNQPAFHILYLYAAAGEPWKLEKWSRKVCTEIYNAGPRGFPGDEDTGSMSSWYIFSSLGFFPLCPGRPEYVLTSPLFSKAVLHLPNGKTFTILAENNDDKNIYVQRRELNGEEFSKTWIGHTTITNGGKLEMQMGQNAKVRKVEPDELPYSASRENAP